MLVVFVVYVLINCCKVRNCCHSIVVCCFCCLVSVRQIQEEEIVFFVFEKFLVGREGPDLMGWPARRVPRRRMPRSLKNVPT